MTSIDDGERTPARCFTEEEEDYGKKKNIDLIHCGGILILGGKRRHRSRASTASGRSGGFGLATEQLLFFSAAKLGWHGWALVQVSASLIFFYFNSFLLFPVFYFTISNPNLLFCFAGLN
jgi:hypothetical protein